MSTSYEIQRWDAVQTSPKSTAPNPALYVLPDATLMAHIRANDFYIPIQITNTQSPYDSTVMAKCIPSQDAAGYRPNFQAETNYIVLLPDTDWKGYPVALGTVTTLADAAPKSSEKISEFFTDYKNSNIHIYLLYAISVLLFCVVARYYASPNRKNTYV